MNKKLELNYETLKKQIDLGKSSHDAALTFGVSKTQILKKAKEVGLRFTNKSFWRSLWAYALILKAM